MRRRYPSHDLAGAILATACVGLLGCSTTPVEPVVEIPQQAVLYTCCNLFHDSKLQINDGNYRTGTPLPAGTTIRITDVRRYTVLFEADGKVYTLTQRFGFSEPFPKYIEKIFMKESPAAKIDAYAEPVRGLVKTGKIAVGMSREQVLHALGHPPRHGTPRIDFPVWKYWLGRFDEYFVYFDDAGRVKDVNARAPHVVPAILANTQ